MPEATQTTLGHVLAANIAAARRSARDVLTDEPLTQAALAHEVEMAGLAWTQSTVALVETGRRQVSAVELVVLSMVLRVPLSGLLDPGAASVVNLGESPWTAAFVRKVAKGDVANLDDEPSEGTFALPPHFDASLRQVVRIAPVLYRHIESRFDEFDARWGLDTSAMSARQHRAIALADGPIERAVQRRLWRLSRKAHRELDVRIEPRDVAAVAWRLWQSSYEDERERRVNERVRVHSTARTKQALRGHVVRDLDREIFEEILRVSAQSEGKGKHGQS